MRLLAEKLEVIEATGVLGIDLEWLNSNYQRALFHYVRKCSAHRLRELARPRRRTALVCFLRQSYRDAVDQAVDMFDKLLTRTVAHAERELDQHLREQRRTIRSALLSLRSVGKLILDDTITDAALRQRVFQTVSRQELSAQMEQLSDWVTGSKSDVFHGVIKRFSYLQRFSHFCHVRYPFPCCSGRRMLPDCAVPATAEGFLATSLPRRSSATRVRQLVRAVGASLPAQVAPQATPASGRTACGSDGPQPATASSSGHA